MESALLAVAVLACPLGMLLMGVVMWKGMGSKRVSGEQPTLDDLHAEHQKLGGEIERLEQAQASAPPEPVER